MKRKIVFFIFSVFLVSLAFICLAFAEEKTTKFPAKEFIEQINKLGDVSREWTVADSEERAVAWDSWTREERDIIWNKIGISRKIQLFGDIEPKARADYWGKMSHIRKVELWDELGKEKNKDVRNKFWKELDKEHRSELWFMKRDDGKTQESLLNDETKTALFKSLETKKEKEEMLHQILTSKQNIEKMARRGIGIKAPEKIKIELGDADINSLKFEGDKLVSKRVDMSDGGYVKMDEISPWINSVAFGKDGEVKMVFANQGEQKQKRTVVLRAGTVDSNGNLEFNPVTNKEENYFVPEMSLMYGEGGEITVDKTIEQNGKQGVEMMVESGAVVKMGDNFYKQFYSLGGRSNKLYDSAGYVKAMNEQLARQGKPLIKDEAGVVRVGIVGDSPSTFGYIPQVKNTIITTGQGDVYAGRREMVNFFHNFQSNINPVDLSKEGNYIVLHSGEKTSDIKINTNDYAGFIANKDFSIESLSINGKGGINPSDNLGKYVYVRNGFFGITIDGDKTLVSGNVQRAYTSAGQIWNVKNSNDVYTLEKTEEGFVFRRIGDDSRISVNSQLWEGTRVLGVSKAVAQSRQKFSGK